MSVFRPGSGGRHDGLIRALWVGHHVEVKRVDRLVQAFARAAAARPQLRLTLLGEGEDRAAIEALVRELGLAERVAFEPAGDRAAIAQAMQAHDFLVISSVKETFGLVALEALACGIPVLSTACGGPQDVIAKPELGLIVGNDIEGLERGLEAMADRHGASDPARLHAHVRDHFSWDTIADRLVGLYGTLLAPRARRVI